MNRSLYIPTSQQSLKAGPNEMSLPLAFHYARLGLKPSASRSQLATAYRAAALKNHPDTGGDAVSFAEICESYEAILSTARPDYIPASVRSHAASSANDWKELLGIMGAIVVPSAIGVAVGIRLMYTGADRSGLRAGGTSRVVIREDGAVEGFHDARHRDMRERVNREINSVRDREPA